VGSQECKDCHWREHDSWKHTLHSKFVQEASEYTVIGDFERKNTLAVKVTKNSPQRAREEVTTKMYIKDGKYFVNTIGPDWEFHDYEISHVIGINREQSYITKFPNGALHVLPVEWEVDEKKWEGQYGLKKHYPGDGKYWSDPSRIWQFKCGSCHVTGMNINYNESSDSFNTTWADLGIGCEACHGPGSNHIRSAREFFEGEKETIVNPSKLPWKLRAMVCGQCHNWGSSTAEVTPHKEGFPKQYSFAYGYEVGKPLYLSYTEELDEEKKHHQQYNEWEKSAHSRAGIMCTTCHGVHQEGAHKNPNISQTKLPGDTLCTGCHTTLVRKAAHRIHTFGSCVACHMPKSKGHEHSHTFEFVSPEESLRAGGVDKKQNSCSGCHHHKDSPLTGLIEFLDTVKKEDMPVPFSVHQR
jgi:predicted CXXCH cytochrome family protein